MKKTLYDFEIEPLDYPDFKCRKTNINHLKIDLNLYYFFTNKFIYDDKEIHKKRNEF